jgi:hypothetical protein
MDEYEEQFEELEPSHKSLDDLSASDFPGVDPDKFFDWWKEMVFLDGYDKTEQPGDNFGFERVQSFFELFSWIKLLPLYFKCKKLQKRAGITKQQMKKFKWFYTDWKRTKYGIFITMIFSIFLLSFFVYIFLEVVK